MSEKGKKAHKTTARVLVSVLLLFFALALTLELPPVQSFITAKVLDIAQKAINGKVSIGKVIIKPFNAVYLEDIVILDKCSPVGIDTFFTAKKICATMSLKGLTAKEGIHVGKVRIEDALFHLVIENKMVPGKVAATNLERIFTIVPPEQVPQSTGKIFDLRTLRVKNVRYRMTNLIATNHYKGIGINWNDLDATLVNLKARHLMFWDGTMHFIADHIDIDEKSGFRGRNMKGSGRVGHGATIVHNFHLEDNHTVADFPHFSMTYGNARRMQDFVNNVVLEVFIKDSDIDLKTISYFSSLPFNDKVVIHVDQAHEIGPVNDMWLKYFSFSHEKSGTAGRLSGRLKYAANPDRDIEAEVDIPKLGFTTQGIEQFLSDMGPALKIKQFAPGQTFNLAAKANGPLSDLKCKFEISSEIGVLDADANLLGLGIPGRVMEIRLKADSKDLDIGRILQSKALGVLTMQTGLKATLGKNMNIRLDSLEIKEFNALGYGYKDIVAAGSLDNGFVEARLLSNDPNLQLTLDAGYNLKAGNGDKLLKLNANIPYLNLPALHIDKRGYEYAVSLKIDSDVNGTLSGDKTGELNIRDIRISDPNTTNNIGDMCMSIADNSDDHRLRFHSKILSADFVGEKPVMAAVQDIIDAGVRNPAPSLLASKANAGQDKKYGRAAVGVILHDTRTLLSNILPGTYVAAESALGLNLDENGLLTLNLQSDRIALKTDYVKELTVDATNATGPLSAEIKGAEIKVGGLSFKGGRVNLDAHQDDADIHLHYDSSNLAQSTADLGVNLSFSRDKQDSLVLKAKTSESQIKFQDYLWKLEKSELTIGNGNILIDSLYLHCGDQAIRAQGGFSKTLKDTMDLRIDNFDLSQLDTLLLGKLGLSGRLSMDACVKSPSTTALDVTGNARIESLASGDEKIGDISAGAVWDNAKKRFNLSMDSKLGDDTPIWAQGWLSPSDGKVKLDARFKDFNVAAAKPFLTSIFSDIGGLLNGQISVKGSLKEPVLESSGTRMDNIRLTLVPTNVSYILNGPFTADSKGIRLDKAEVRDLEQGKGIIDGGLILKKKHPELDVKVKAKELMAINLQESNSSLYGKLYTTVDAKVHGPFNGLVIEGSVRTAKQGNIHIPISSAVASSEDDILTFTENKPLFYDPYDEMVSQFEELNEKLEKKGITLKIKAAADSQTEAVIDINKATGNYASVRGNANVGVGIDSGTQTFILAGDYEITSGKYHFSIPGLIAKDFNVVPGSKISVNGNLNDINIDLSAKYTIKTSIANLIADTTSVSSQRPVDCILHIKNNISHPEISFGVEVQDLDPTTKSKVEAALNTEDKVQKQFVALLVMGMFLPSEQSGVINGGEALYKNISQLVSNQFNSIMQRLDIPLDLGLGYEQDRQGKDVFDVAVSTQLFNNRVVVNGSVSNRKYNSNSTQDVMGDIDIEVKIDKQGKLRLTVFSHSADQYTSFLDYSQRNGIGLSYQMEYNDFFKAVASIFLKKEEKERLLQEAMLNDKKLKTIKIDEQAVSDTKSSRSRRKSGRDDSRKRSGKGA